MSTAISQSYATTRTSNIFNQSIEIKNADDKYTPSKGKPTPDQITCFSPDSKVVIQDPYSDMLIIKGPCSLEFSDQSVCIYSTGTPQQFILKYIFYTGKIRVNKRTPPSNRPDFDRNGGVIEFNDLSLNVRIKAI